MNFTFDDHKRFSENLESFLTAVETVDAEMATILRANAAKLAELVTAGNRNTTARSDFNSTIAAALDKMVDDTNESEAN